MTNLELRYLKRVNNMKTMRKTYYTVKCARIGGNPVDVFFKTLANAKEFIKNYPYGCDKVKVHNVSLETYDFITYHIDFED